VNDRIRAPQVRLVGSDGAQIGIVSVQEALRRAQELDLDLVEVAPLANPPVCRIMDYGKFKYERDIRQKEARKHQARVEVKEMKMRPKIDPHDYGTKKGHIERFLKTGARVKVTIMFRGREMAHTELGRKLLDRLTGDLQELATVESYPKLDGRNMVMLLAPVKRPVGKASSAEEAEPEDAEPVEVPQAVVPQADAGPAEGAEAQATS
jgi:translation initiation factor IF-3